MAISQVQKKAFGSTVSDTSHNIVFDSAPTQNNLLILCVVADTTVDTPSTWTLAVSNLSFTGNYIFYKIAGSSESATINVTITDSTACAMQAFEYSGIVTTSPLDQVVEQEGQGGGGTITTGTTAATSQDDELAIALIGMGLGENATTSVTSYSDSFFEEDEISTTNGVANVRNSCATKTLTAIGTVTTTATINTSGTGGHSGLLATFKASEEVPIAYSIAWITA